jgi:hypothetical protein
VVRHEQKYFAYFICKEGDEHIEMLLYFLDKKKKNSMASLTWLI